VNRRCLVRAGRALPALAAALLAACTTTPVREPAPLPSAAPAAPIAVPDVATAPSAPILANPSPWPRLRRSFAMQGCDYRPEVQHWARVYARGPRQFAANWKNALPFLLIVVDELDRRHLPGEFAMLPYVESSYQPLPARGDLPAGMWQLDPATAREAGLAVGADYDGRLDAVASTRTALDLLERYYREFSDWRLANMAFNSGEFRVKKLIGERDPRTLSAAELSNVAFSKTTHEHLDRLLALACIIDDPQKFGVKLPEPRDEDRLQAVALQAGMDLRLAARLADVALGDMRRWNAGYRRNRMAPTAPHSLLLPSSRVDRFQAGADAVPPTLWGDWREERAARTSRIGSWASQIGVPVAVLALANAIGEESTVAPSTQLLLPGREPEPIADAPKKRERGPRMHVVVAGDTLSHIARRYSIPLAVLKRMNPQTRGALHPGDRLRVGVGDD